MLSPGDAETLLGKRGHADRNMIDQAIETGLLDTAQVEVLELLSRPLDVAPGYEVQDYLGEGVIAIVFRARDKKLQRSVALKVIKLSSVHDRIVTMRSKVEAQLAARIQHPNIATAYDYGLHQGRMFLAMEFVEGETLQSLIDRNGPCGETFTWGIVRQAASALAVASKEHITHRDIKPSNLLLTDPIPGVEILPGLPMVKVADFGLAVHRAADETRMTVEGAAVGTPCYLAPEQLNAVDADFRADIYALGATAFHMLAGREPFAGATMTRVLVAKTTGDERWRDELPDGLSAETVALFRRMTAFRASERIADYRVLIETIDQLVERRQVSTRQTNSNFKAQIKHSTRSKLVVWGWLLGFVVVSGVFSVAYRSIDPTRADLHPSPVDAAGPMPRDLVPTGWTQFLFDGESTPISQQRGNWTATVDEDGARVLEGKDSWLALKVPQPEGLGSLKAYVLKLGVNLLSDSQAELHFARIMGGTASESRTVLRMSDGTAMAGRRPSVDAKFERLPNTPSVPLESTMDESPVYQTIHLVRQPDGWFVRVNREQVTAVPASPMEETDQVFVVVPKGTVHFTDIEVVQLCEPPDRS